MIAPLYLVKTLFCRGAGSMRARHPTTATAVTLVLLLYVVANGIAAGLPANPAPVDVIALSGTVMPESIELPESAAVAIENMVADSLRELGFEVIPSHEFETLWRGRLEEAGGYFDVVSGRADLEKRRILLASTLRELNERHGVRFLIRSELVVVTAEYTRGKASWDGTKETAAPSGSGEVPALSLAVRAEDVSGRLIGQTRAGIQLLAKHSIWNRRYGPVPKEKLLDDDEQLREAVEQALTAVADAVRSAPTPEPQAEPIGADPTFETFDLRIEPPAEGVGVVAPRALVLPGDPIAVPLDVQTRYTEALRAGLEERGWWVLPPEAYERTLREVALELGGIYDPLTGTEYTNKRTTAHSAARNRLAESCGATLFVTAGIFVRPARIAGEKATWDGVSEKVADIATWKKLLTTTRGTTKALSFGVMIEDIDGTPRYIGWGGIQLIDRLEKGRFVDVPSERLFADPELDRRAVDLALRGWPGEQNAPSEGDRP